MKRPVLFIVVAACIAALCCGLLSGCAASSASGASGVTLTKEQQENRAYMQKVNQAMDGFQATLAQFSAALKASDAESAKKCLDSVETTFESLKSLTPPDACKDISERYIAGAEKLKQALQDYADLLAANIDVKSAAYAEKIAAIQSVYDAGVAELKAGDELATHKE